MRAEEGKGMSDKSANGVLVVTFGLTLILLLVVGGAGFYYLTARQQMAVAAAEEATRTAEVRAMIETERAQVSAARASHRSAGNSESSPAQDETIRAAVESVLRAQEEAWNRGDLDAFMAHYWKSDDLTFSSGGKTTRGWNATMKRYLERYPTREKMGRVSFGELEIMPLGDSAALVLGQWKLDRESEPVAGNFSLILRKLDGHWVIAHDHTSRLEE